MPDQTLSHQTVKLAKGKHRSAREGACVMELASMLAGEPFSDRPESVSPAIGGFLRAYNDHVDDALRQELYPIASAVVGSRATAEIEALRIKRIVEWGRQMRRARLGLVGALLARTLSADARTNSDRAGEFAVHAIGRRSWRAHPQALALVEELLGHGRTEQPAAQPPASRRVVDESAAAAGLRPSVAPTH